MFKLSKKTSKRIVKDAVSSYFGFDTQKQSLDRKIKNYELQTENSINHLIAQRNIIISKLDAKINYFNNFLKIYEKFLNYYENIKKLSEEDILKDNSEINIRLYRSDGTKFATGNYNLLKNLIRQNKQPNEAAFLAKQLQEKYNITIIKYIDAVIKGNGVINLNGKTIENLEIHTNFMLLKQICNQQLLRDLNNNCITTDITCIYDVLNVEKAVKRNYSQTKLIIDKYQIQRDTLNNMQAGDKNIVEQIELARKLMETTPEYVTAKASHDYLEEIHKLK